MEKHIEAMIAKARDEAENGDSGNAMRISQAAVNAANVLAVLDSIKRLNK